MSQAGQDVKHRHHEAFATMETTHEATRAELMWHIALFMRESMCPCEASAKREGGDEGGGENFRVVHLTLGVFPMTKCFQQIITKAIHEYNPRVPRGSSPVVVQ